MEQKMILEQIFVKLQELRFLMELQLLKHS
jgi:hypothetical protein